jgi:RNA polymerase-binding transcription factor DksA
MSIDTSRFRGELEERRERLLATIAHHDIGGSTLDDDAGDFSPSVDNHLADMASETYYRELDEGLEGDARERLREVDEALARIETGGYGFCRVCGKEIPVERLEALPWTTLCIDDARKLAR